MLLFQRLVFKMNYNEIESGPFDSLHTLVEVCNLLPNQDEQYQVAMVVDADTGNSQPRHTILAQRVPGGTGDASVTNNLVPAPKMIETQTTKTSNAVDKPVRRRGNGAAQIRPVRCVASTRVVTVTTEDRCVRHVEHSSGDQSRVATICPTAVSSPETVLSP